MFEPISTFKTFNSRIYKLQVLALPICPVLGDLSATRGLNINGGASCLMSVHHTRGDHINDMIQMRKGWTYWLYYLIQDRNATKYMSI